MTFDIKAILCLIRTVLRKKVQLNGIVDTLCYFLKFFEYLTLMKYLSKYCKISIAYVAFKIRRSINFIWT